MDELKKKRQERAEKTLDSIDGVLDNFGRSLIENYSHPEFAEHLAQTPLTGAGVEALAKATAEKRPALFVTAQFGNHEAPRQILTRVGHSVAGRYRPFTNPYFDADYRRTIGALGGTVFAQGRRGTIGLIRYLREANQGAILREGMNVVIAGRPNAGKSSLLNALAGQERAIVTDIAGTTRDVLKEHIHIDGMPLHIIDTAGLRDTGDAVEKIGIERAWAEIEKADRVLFMVDARDTDATDPHRYRCIEQHATDDAHQGHCADGQDDRRTRLRVQVSEKKRTP